MSIHLWGERDLDDRARAHLARIGGRLSSAAVALGAVQPPVGYRAFAESLGSYANLGFFIRFAAHIEKSGGRPSEPFRDREGNYKAQPLSKRFPHLINTWNGETYYLPIHLEVPLVGVRRGGLRGIFGGDSCSAGSSNGLLAELDDLNTFLAMQSDLGVLGEEALEALTEEDVWGLEKSIWATLHWFARESIRQVGLIRFS